MSFDEVMAQRFDGALQVQSYVSHLQMALYRHGFDRTSSLLALALCRDELHGRLQDELLRAWGGGFMLNGLAGMLCGGVTSLKAAAAHTPIRDGRERLLCVAQTHVAVGAGGEIGLCARRGRPGPSIACGALAAVAVSMATGAPPETVDPDDTEFTWVWRRLARRFSADEKPDLLGLTFAAHDAIVEDTRRLLALVMDTERADYAIATGITVHGPTGREYVWPGALCVVARGELTEADWPA